MRHLLDVDDLTAAELAEGLDLGPANLGWAQAANRVRAMRGFLLWLFR